MWRWTEDMIVEEEVFISEVKVSYFLFSTCECSPLFIDYTRWVSIGGSQICKKRRTCVDIRVNNYHRVTEHVTLDNNHHMLQT